MRTGGKRCASDAVSSEVTTDQTSGISIISASGMRKKCHGLNGQRRGRRSGTASRSSGRPAPISVPLSITPPSRLAVDAPGADLELDERDAVSYTHLRAHETRHDLVCRLLLEKKKKQHTTT